MDIYERYCKIRDFRRLKDANVAEISGIGKSTFSDWKKGRSAPKDDKMKKIADALDVSVDYLKGDSNVIKCEICGLYFDLLWDTDRNEHEKFHEKFLKIKELYPFFTNFSDANKIRTDSIFAFRNTQKPFEERLSSFDDYLKASFSMEISRNNYEIDRLNYEDFCKIEVSTLEQDYAISEELIDALVDKYGVDKNFMNGNEQLLARISNNEHLIRILRYAERLNPEMLESIEIQIKALVESQKEG